MFFPVHNLKIGGKLSVDQLDKFNIISKLGHHTILNYEGMISSQRSDKYNHGVGDGTIENCNGYFYVVPINVE